MGLRLLFPLLPIWCLEMEQEFRFIFSTDLDKAWGQCFKQVHLFFKKL